MCSLWLELSQKSGSHKKKRNTNVEHDKRNQFPLSFDPLLYPPGCTTHVDDDPAFDDMIETFLPELLRTRALLLEQKSDYDEQGICLRPLTRSEISSLLMTGDNWARDVTSTILLRKLKLSQERCRSHSVPVSLMASTRPLSQIQPPSGKIAPRQQVAQMLEEIQTTPFKNSFLSRLQGDTRGFTSSGLIAVDWETTTSWMSLMNDIRDHYEFAHPERDQSVVFPAPITYSTLQSCHLDQIHDLLERVFWTGIDVSDFLDYSPERCTVVACYKRLVVGVAIMSSPQETYITYLAVKAGWDKAQVARTMLFHLIKMNPKRDITLHVSANNSAMLLYNQFGFKAEEFIAGFYEDYLDPVSRGSKNAFRLRLRQ